MTALGHMGELVVRLVRRHDERNTCGTQCLNETINEVWGYPRCRSRE
jgi:hypothetical protein